MTTFVLVPGAWLGGWAWREVARALCGAGHEAHPLTLTGLAERAHLGGSQTDLETHIVDSGPPPHGVAQIEFNPPEERERTRAAVRDGWRCPPPHRSTRRRIR